MADEPWVPAPGEDVYWLTPVGMKHGAYIRPLEQGKHEVRYRQKVYKVVKVFKAKKIHPPVRRNR